MTTAGLPPIDLSARGDPLPGAARHTLVMGVLGAHVLAGWALMQIDAVRHAVSEAAPLFVSLVAPPAPPVPPPPPPPVRKPPPKREPPPIISAPPAPSVEPPSFVVPAIPDLPPPVVVAAPEPPPPAPPPPPPAPPPEPKTIPPTAVRYVTPPAPVYPAASRRLREAGRVVLRVQIGADGRARQVMLSRSSGHARLDESAAASVRSALFAPYTENGVPLVVWTLVPIEFELES
ncbi:MAG: energy transducer TonB [Burkholderiaceae bacterium]|nr:energy transducer TonB [Burkholderiaceae bacterium]